MFSKTFALVFAAAALSVSALDIDTPEKLTQCDTVEIKWSGKKAPFTLSVLPSCDSDSEDPLLEFTSVNATSYKWTVNLPSSTGAVAFAITDNEGNEAYTDDVTIQKSDNAACLSAASSTAASATSVASTASASASASAAPASTNTERTTLVVSETSTANPTAPVNVGSGSTGSSSTGSGSTGSTNEVNGAIAPVASAFAGMIGVATALLVLL